MSESPADHDATLQDLAVEPGEMIPGFWGGRTSFALVLPHDVEVVHITATASDPNATVSINGQPVANAERSDSIPVNVGRTVLNVQATTPDGQTGPNYELKVHRATPRPDWTRVIEHAAFQERDSEGEVVFDGRMWVIGGYLPEVVNDVWSTPNGIDWTHTGDVPTDAGVNIPVCMAHAGRMWVTAQDGQLYATSDGVKWDCVGTPPWAPRHGAGCVVFDGRMWVLGGAGRGMRNDVWSSADGEHWTQETPEAPWSPRMVFSNLVVHRDRLWLIGGGIQGYQPFKAYRDVWSSPDGVHWEQATDAAPWPGRIWTSCATYRDRIWLLGGFRAQPTWNNFDDVWYSPDGVQWSQLPTDHIWEPRHEISALVFDDSLWVIAGNAWPLKNDTWRLHIDGMCFLSRPVLEEYIGTEYRYEAHADFHADGGPLRYRLIESPDWLSIDAASGCVRGRAPASGDYPVEIEAVSTTGGSAQHRYVLHILAG